MSPLLKKQLEFSKNVLKLLQKAYEFGYEVKLGEVFRDSRCSHWNKNSFHGKGLAIDIHLFKDGKYLRSTEDHRQLGEYWKSLGGTWGGDFKIPDGNHYSWGE